MSSLLPAITVVAGLIQRQGAWLICQRRGDGAFPLKWEFPGGKVEPGETCEQGLRRELREELGIEAEIGPEVYRTHHEYPGKYSVELIFYQVPAFRGALRNDNFERIRWESPTRLPGFDFLDGDAELIRLLCLGKLAIGKRARITTTSSGEGFSMSQKGLFIVMAKVKPEDEEAFNRWYNEDHLPKALERFPGVRSGRRYKILEGEDDYQYMALYEFESYDTMHATVNSDVIRGLIQEFNQAFGEGGRKRLLAVEVKALTVG